MGEGRAVGGRKASPFVCLATPFTLASPKHSSTLATRHCSSFLPGSAQNVENDVTSTKQTVGEFLPGATTAHHPLVVSRSVQASAPFLTGSGSQTEIDVTHSKQTTEKFLTGARTHIRNFDFSHDFAPPTSPRFATLQSPAKPIRREKVILTPYLFGWTGLAGLSAGGGKRVAAGVGTG